MPCPKCGSVIVRFGKADVCPVCNGIRLLNRQATVLELNKNLQELESGLSNILKNYAEKNKLLRELGLAKREIFTGLFPQVPTI